VPRGSAGATVLVVDDEAWVRRVLTKHFTDRGYGVEVAANAVEAVTQIRAHAPDVILLDLELPGSLDGLDLLRAIGGRIPIVVITGNTRPEVGQATLREGAIDYVAKPFDFEYLDAAVAAAALYKDPEPAITG
jgi:CheY-like chemotaxis protein